MKPWFMIAAGVLFLACLGCAEDEKPMTKEEAAKKIFAPTKVEDMSPEMRSKIPANGLGPAGDGGARPNLPGATPPPSLNQGNVSGS